MFWSQELSISFVSLVDQLVHMNINMQCAFPISIYAVYAKCSRAARRPLWAALEDLCDQNQGPWLIAGD